jgi:hypothetical protein
LRWWWFDVSRAIQKHVPFPGTLAEIQSDGSTFAMTHPSTQEQQTKRRYTMKTKILIALTFMLAFAVPVKAQTIYAGDAADGPLLAYTAWAWKERAGMNATYGGLTGVAECVPNAITFRHPTLAEWNLAGAAAGFTPAEYTGYKAFTFVCPYGGYTILVSPHHPTLSRLTALHEAGHGLTGFGHTTASDSVMYWAVTSAKFITPKDVDFIRTTPGWPLTGPGNKCFVEINDEWDIYVPEIGGNQIRLEYEGNIGGYESWSIAGLTASHLSNGACPTSQWVSSTEVTFTDTRGYTLGNFSYVRFLKIGAYWRLVAAR